VFADTRPTGDLPQSVCQRIKAVFLTIFHKVPGNLVFSIHSNLGPWTTVAYYDHWGQMGAEGEGLTCSFPVKWISSMA